MSMNIQSMFSLNGKIAIITGGAGLLGRQHAEAIAKAGGIPILADVPGASPRLVAKELQSLWNTRVLGAEMDITKPEEVLALSESLEGEFGGIDILINNAANNPKVEDASDKEFSRLEHFDLGQWRRDLDVGLTGAFLCSQIIGSKMALRGNGVILNIASDLALISPDQRLYRKEGLPEDRQPVKPVTYPVIKSALIGLTRYLATYWAEKGVRVNALSPGGVYTSQDERFVEKLSNLIPMHRMAVLNEYQGAIVFLCSEASSYMTGSNLIIDGGRTVW